MNYRFDNYIDYPNFDDIYKNANVGLNKVRQIIYFFETTFLSLWQDIVATRFL